MKLPPDDAILAAIILLRTHKHDAAADWLNEQFMDCRLRSMARKAGMPYARFIRELDNLDR